MIRLIVCTAELVCKTRQHQVTSLGHRQCRRDGLQIAHLTDEHDVRVLAQHVPKGFREAVRIRVDLPLVHQTLAMFVHELDGILDRDDMLVALAVDLVDH